MCWRNLPDKIDLTMKLQIIKFSIFGPHYLMIDEMILYRNGRSFDVDGFFDYSNNMSKDWTVIETL